MIEDTLTILGYSPEDDAWETDGRRTYSSSDNATKAYLTTITGIFGRQGWDRQPKKDACMRFRHSNGEVLEIEPGGAGVSGHYLHYMKAEAANEH